jgi:hypothetical protein
MLGYRHSGFSVDTSVCIAAHDCAGLERSLRYCARPQFALKRLRKAGGERVYRCAKQHSEPGGKLHGKRGSQPEPAQPALPKSQAHDLWAVLIARICEVFPRVCPISASVGEARQQRF